MLPARVTKALLAPLTFSLIIPPPNPASFPFLSQLLIANELPASHLCLSICFQRPQPVTDAIDFR